MNELAGKLTGSDAGEERLAACYDDYDVVIIGAGINGCGLFRDLSAQNIRCLIFDKADFCAGASAAPSRLIHGGIKYLETGEFRLVRESAMERNLLLKNAPHYVKSLETLIPVYSWFGGIIPSIRRFLGFSAKLNDRGALITEVGLLIYDFFGRVARTMPHHSRWLRAKALANMPELNPSIVAAGIYYEARITHAERLGLELLQDGISDMPENSALNYISLSHTDASGNLVLRDEISGFEKNIRARLIVNAGGAWIDKVNAALGVQTHYMGGNKGSHLVVSNQRLYEALQGRMVYFGTADGRVNLAYPFMGNVLVGSTDIPEANPDQAQCDQYEFDYLRAVIKEIFPDINITPEEVLLTYCGVRPLPHAGGLNPGEVSRDHSIGENKQPQSRADILSLIGGKWTTYRGFSEQAADLILKRLDKTRKCFTADLAIGGGQAYPKSPGQQRSVLNQIAAKGNLSDSRAKTLFDRYGTYALTVAEYLAAHEDKPLKSLPDYGKAELAFICSEEKVGHLSDLLFRRTDIVLSGRISKECIAEVGSIAGEILGWSADRLNRELLQTSQICEKYHIKLS